MVCGWGERFTDCEPIAGTGKLRKRPAGRMQRLYQLCTLRMQADGERAERRLKPGAERFEKTLLAGPEPEEIRIGLFAALKLCQLLRREAPRGDGGADGADALDVAADLMLREGGKCTFAGV